MTEPADHAVGDDAGRRGEAACRHSEQLAAQLADVADRIADTFDRAADVHDAMASDPHHPLRDEAARHAAAERAMAGHERREAARLRGESGAARDG